MRPIQEPMKRFLYIKKPLTSSLIWGYKHTPLEWTDTPLPFLSKGKNFQITWRKIYGLILACKGFICKKTLHLFTPHQFTKTGYQNPCAKMKEFFLYLALFDHRNNMLKDFSSEISSLLENFCVLVMEFFSP